MTTTPIVAVPAQFLGAAWASLYGADATLTITSATVTNQDNTGHAVSFSLVAAGEAQGAYNEVIFSQRVAGGEVVHLALEGKNLMAGDALWGMADAAGLVVVDIAGFVSA